MNLVAHLTGMLPHGSSPCRCVVTGHFGGYLEPPNDEQEHRQPSAAEFPKVNRRWSISKKHQVVDGLFLVIPQMMNYAFYSI